MGGGKPMLTLTPTCAMVGRRTRITKAKSIVAKDNLFILLPPLEMIINRLLHDQIILYGPDSSDAPCYLTCFVDGVLRINKATQLDDALAGFNTDLE